MSRQTDRLLVIMERLRDRENGCPWDLEQDFAGIAPHTIEEAYEVADAIENDDMESLKDELGDLLFQVVYHAQMAQEIDAFAYEDVASAICEKMVRRHPHVFGQDKIADATAQTHAWEKQKADERNDDGQGSLLDGVALALPALTRAQKLQKRAARGGFDWPNVAEAFAKLLEEIAEFEHEIGSADRDALIEEFGDLLFSLVNVGRKLDIDCETVLRRANGKFERRFRRIEDTLKQNSKSIDEASLDEMESIWNKAKKSEKKDP